jgi:hypothetical protein
MRDLMLAEMAKMLVGASGSYMRWTSLAEFVYVDMLKKDISTKAGRKECSRVKLDKIDYSVLDDNALLSFYTLVVRKFYTQM